MARPLTILVAVLAVLSSVGFTMAYKNDIFEKIIPEFIFCFDFVNFRSFHELAAIMNDFPTHITSRQQKCFLRCLLRRYNVFLEPYGKLWSWKNAYEFLMSFTSESAGREPYVKSILFFCIRKKNKLVTKYGCKNALNFFKCLVRHGMSFGNDAEFWRFRQEHIKENPYTEKKMNHSRGANITILRPTRKQRANESLPKLIYDEPGDTAKDHRRFLRMRIHSVARTTDEGGDQNVEDKEEDVDNDEGDGTGKNDDDDDDDDDNDDNVNSYDDTYKYDEPLKITASEAYQRGTLGEYYSGRWSSFDGERKTIVTNIPDIASQANKLNLKWVDMTNND